jgi:hypothetical protein
LRDGCLLVHRRRALRRRDIHPEGSERGHPGPKSARRTSSRLGRVTLVTHRQAPTSLRDEPAFRSSADRRIVARHCARMWAGYFAACPRAMVKLH